ncbi:MAG TPA: PAS domain S-box protein [Clostridia bacterium]|nr:PAS domain S-box protein [Clostridia bacterium]
MTFDINTLAIALSIFNFMQVAIIFSQHRKDRNDEAPFWWALGGACAAFGFGLYALRQDLTPLREIIIILNNSFLITAMVFVYIGVRKLQELKANGKALAVFLLLFYSAIIYFTLPTSDSYAVRRILIFVGVGVISFSVARSLIRHKQSVLRVWNKLVATVFLLFGLFSLVGIAGTLLTPQMKDPDSAAMIQGAMFIGIFVASTIWTFGFLRMNSRRLSEETRSAKERFESVFSTSPDGVFIASLEEAKIWQVNTGFTKLTGFAREEAVGKTMLEIGIYEDPLIHKSIIGELRQGGVCENKEAIIKSDKGERLTVLISAKQISLSGVAHYTCVMRDISERKIAEQKLVKSEEQYRLLFKNTVEIVFVSQFGKIKLCNPKTSEMTGYTQEELLTQLLTDFVHPDDRDAALEHHMSPFVQGESVVGSHEFRFIAKDGSIRWVEKKSVIIEWEDKPAMLNFLTDITQRKKAVSDLRQSEEKYRFITEFASDVIWVLNLSKNEYTYISPSVYNLRGYMPSEAKSLGVVKAFTPDSMELVRYSIIKNLESFKANPGADNHYMNEFQQVCKDGSIVWVEESTKYRYNSVGEIEVVGVTRNIEERKKTESEILYLSYHDQLTGLHNRRFFDEIINELENEKCAPLTLIMADVNGLKLTNDAFGHKAGDRILIKVAEILKSNCRDSDYSARIGGDEFVLLLPRTDATTAQAVLKRINESMALERKKNEVISVSIGFAVRNEAAEEINDIFKKAEDNMYRHKLVESSSVRSKTISLIMNTLYEKNDREMLHSNRVGELCKIIAQTVGLDSNASNQLRLAGLMHDIGKIGIEENILNKPSGLNKDEWAEIRRHTEIGYRILSSVNEFSEIADFVLEHHERWDGKGYPRGLKGEEISLQARIINLADTYDAITSDRPYQKALTQEAAAAEIKRCAGTQFDPQLAEIFLEKVLCKEWKNSITDHCN